MKIVAGIDVSKEKLDCFVSGETLTESNTASGHRKLCNWLKAKGAELVVFEATGIYHREIVKDCVKKGFRVSVVNPKKIRNFATALGKKAKTDKLDAEVIARFGELAEVEEYKLPSAEEEELNDLVRSRLQLVQSKAQLKQKMSSMSKSARKHFEKPILVLEEGIQELDILIADKIDEVEDLKNKKELLCQVKGIAAKTAAILLVTVPELGSLDRRQVASLVGLAPFNKDSGGKSGVRSITGGRIAPRCALYLVTITAVRFNPTIREFYQRLIANGKLKKVALVASMRKLLIILNAVLRDGHIDPELSVLS